MTEGEARACVAAIQAHLDGARVLIYDLHQRRGWESLGYSSWRECVTQEFESSSQHLYRQLKAAQVERVVAPDQPVGSIPEKQLRPLASLPPGKQAEAYAKAVERSPTGQPTAREVKAAVVEVLPPPLVAEPEPEEPPDISAQRAAGIIPADAAVEVIEPSALLEPIEAEPADEFPSDEEYLDSCPARASLSGPCLKRFDADALAFRAATPHRIKMVHACRPIAKRAKVAGNGAGAWLGKLLHFLALRDPLRWVACFDCKGSGRVPLVGECPRCRGNGYVI